MFLDFAAMVKKTYLFSLLVNMQHILDLHRENIFSPNMLTAFEVAIALHKIPHHVAYRPGQEEQEI